MNNPLHGKSKSLPFGYENVNLHEKYVVTFCLCFNTVVTSEQAGNTNLIVNPFSQCVAAENHTTNTLGNDLFVQYTLMSGTLINYVSKCIDSVVFPHNIDESSEARIK